MVSPVLDIGPAIHGRQASNKQTTTTRQRTRQGVHTVHTFDVSDHFVLTSVNIEKMFISNGGGNTTCGTATCTGVVRRCARAVRRRTPEVQAAARRGRG
jgi:hypothetical protein